MRHLKSFNKLNENKFNYKFKIGDIIRHRSDRYYDELYKVVDIETDTDPNGFCYALERFNKEGDKEDDIIDLWSEDQMRLVPDYEIAAMNIGLPFPGPETPNNEFDTIIRYHKNIDKKGNERKKLKITGLD